MTIAVQCPACQREFHVDERHAGKTRPCPACKRASITIPSPDPLGTDLGAFDPLGMDDFPTSSASTVLPPRKPSSTAAMRARRFWIKAGVCGVLGSVVLGAVIYGGAVAWQKIGEMDLASFVNTAGEQSATGNPSSNLNDRFLVSEPLPEVLKRSAIPWSLFRDDWNGFEMAAIKDVNMTTLNLDTGSAYVCCSDQELYEVGTDSPRTSEVASMGMFCVASDYPLTTSLFDKLTNAAGGMMAERARPLNLQIRYELTRINGYYGADLHITGYPGFGEMGGFVVFAENEISGGRSHVLVLYAGPRDFLTPEQIDAMKATFRQTPSRRTSEAIERNTRISSKSMWKYREPDQGLFPPVPPELAFTPIPWRVYRSDARNYEMLVPRMPVSVENYDSNRTTGFSTMTDWRFYWFVPNEIKKSEMFAGVMDIGVNHTSDNVPADDAQAIKQVISLVLGEVKGSRVQLTQEPKLIDGSPGRHYRISGLDSVLAEAIGVEHDGEYYLILVMGHESLLPQVHLDIVIRSFRRYDPTETLATEVSEEVSPS